MNNIREVKTANVDDALIGKLEELLKEAKGGHLISIAAATVYDDATTGNLVHGAYPVSLIGELRVLERDMIDCYVDLRNHKAFEDY